jgi:hypothetical protein
VKKLLGWLALAIGAMWVVNDPTGAAALIHQVAHALATLAASL